MSRASSTFSCHAPRHEPHPAAGGAAAWRGGAPKVLIVDDDSAVRESLRRVLANEALDVSTAASGAEALQRIGQIRPDLLIADLCLASTDGWALLACEKRLRPNLPIFVITALSARETGGAHEVATEYFQKPPDLDALIEAIRRRLRESGSAQPSSAA